MKELISEYIDSDDKKKFSLSSKEHLVDINPSYEYINYNIDDCTGKNVKKMNKRQLIMCVIKLNRIGVFSISKFLKKSKVFKYENITRIIESLKCILSKSKLIEYIVNETVGFLDESEKQYVRDSLEEDTYEELAQKLLVYNIDDIEEIEPLLFDNILYRYIDFDKLSAKQIYDFIDKLYTKDDILLTIKKLQHKK